MIRGGFVSRVAVATGNYVGDGANNRAIPHGLGTVPKIVCIVNNNTANYGMITLMRGAASTIASCVHNSADDRYAPTDADVTNFYIGHLNIVNGEGGNVNTQTYYWVAFG